MSKWSQVSFYEPTPLFGELLGAVWYMCLKTENDCLKSQTKHPLKVLSFLTQFQENFNSSTFFSGYTKTHASLSSRPKTCAVWVRNEPKT